MMLLISLGAFLAYMLVMLRCIAFAIDTTDRRQSDNAEVGYILFSTLLLLTSYVCLWVFEPWKLTSNSPYSAMFVGFTIFTAAYFFRRVGALIVGRDRRRTEVRRVRRAHE
jgi:NADH:ubiquinone oxidoreductase subunit 6 (subunit J)